MSSSSPTINPQPAHTVEQNQTTIVGIVTPTQSGDVLAVAPRVGFVGTIALEAGTNGTENVVYTAPASITSGGLYTLSYTVTDVTAGDASADGAASVYLDAGPAVTTTNPGLVEAGQERQIGTVTPGLPGDVLTVSLLSGPGTVSLGQIQDGVQAINYTAPAGVAESGPVTVGYSVADPYGGVVDKTATINLDRGPQISGVPHAELEQGQSETIGYATPGVAGDTLTIAQTSGQYGTVALGEPDDDGQAPIIYTAPAHVIASGLDTVSYTITDSNGGTAYGSTGVSLDVGPSVAAVQPHTIEQAQTTQIGTVAVGAPGDVLTLTQAFGSEGTLSLVSQGDDTDAVIYTAPQTVIQSFTDNLAYTVADQNHDVVAHGTGSVTVDGGPQVSPATPDTIEQSQTTVLGTVSPGETGDVLSVSQDAGALGTVTLGAVSSDGSQQIIYTAPATVSASAADAVTYHIVDQYDDTIATRTANVPLDDGPQLAAGTPGVLEQSQTTVLGVVTPGMAGDILSVSQAAGALGAVTLEADTDDGAPAGAEKLVYTAPAAISASATDAITYTLTDQHDGVNQQPGASVTQSVSVQLDAGPSIATATPGVVEQTQTTVLGTVTPGLSGDTLTLTQTGGALGTVSLGAVAADGTQQIIYTAPANVPSSTTDTVGYTIMDQYSDVVASEPATVTLDAGPALVTATPGAVEQGQTTILGTVTPGETGDTLTLTQGAGGVGTVSLGTVQADGTQQVIYTAPASVSSSAPDSVSYSIVDQHDEVVASDSASVLLDRGPRLIATTPATVEQDQTTVLGSVKAGVLGDTLTVTQAPGALGLVTLGPVGESGIQQVIYTAPASVVASGTDVIAYSITDQHDDVVASKTAYVTLDAGPQLVAATPDAVEQGQTTLLGTVAAGLAGDVLTLAQTSDSLGTVTFGPLQADGSRQILYTAPATIGASTTDPVSYTITDEYRGAVASGHATVTLDGGATIAPATPDVLEQNQTTVVGTVTPGETGDSLTLAQAAGSLGVLSLGAVQADGTQQVIYTAPTSIAASGTDPVSYTIADQHNDVIASGSASVSLDAGATIASVTPLAVEQGQATVVGTVTPGLAGDALTLVQAPGSLGTLALGAVQADGTQQVVYTAPASVAVSGADPVGYTITDQHDEVMSSGSATVNLDAGPSVSAVSAASEQGQTVEIGVVTPGLPGDALTLTQTPGSQGVVSLGTVQDDGTQQILYTAPANIAASGADSVSYSITDQHDDAVSSQTASVTLDAGATIVAAQPGTIEENQTTVLGTVTPGVSGDALRITQAAGALGTVSLGAVQANGTQQILYTAPQTVSANGTDTISYSVTDQHDDIIVGNTASVGLDAGPSVVQAIPAVIESGQTTVLGVVTPGESGDTLSVSQSARTLGTVSLGAVQSDGSRQIIYTAPGSVPDSTLDEVIYNVTDQHGGAAPGAIAHVKLDAGPSIATRTPGAVEASRTTVLAVVSPGEPGDTLTLRRSGSIQGTIALGTVQADGTQQVIYTAPSSIAATGTDAVTYQVLDQHGVVVKTASAGVALAITPFTGLAVSADNAAAALTVSLTLDPSAAGSFSNLGGGSVSANGGTYSVTGTAAAVNAALQGLGFSSTQSGLTSPEFQVTLNSQGTDATLYGTGSGGGITGSSSGESLVGQKAGAVVTAASVGGDTLIAGPSGETLDGSGASSGDVFFGAASGGTVFKGGLGHDTMVGGGGSNTVTSGTGGSVIFLGSGQNLVQSQGADTIVGSSGNDTIQAGGAAVTLFAGSGTTSFTGGSAASTVIGGSGGLTVSGGAGGGAFFGSASGNNLLQSGSGTAFLAGAGSGDQLIATGNASDILVAASGNETLDAAGSAGNNILYGGSGADVVRLGSGANTFLAGSGSAAITAGSGSAMFDFMAGIGGSVTIAGFDANRDQLGLFGYGNGEAASALANASVAGGNTTLSLSDGTQITLLGVTGLNPHAVV